LNISLPLNQAFCLENYVNYRYKHHERVKSASRHPFMAAASSLASSLARIAAAVPAGPFCLEGADAVARSRTTEVAGRARVTRV
jgi:hypothetical protein